jgi:hypothetical protein
MNLTAQVDRSFVIQTAASSIVLAFGHSRGESEASATYCFIKEYYYPSMVLRLNPYTSQKRSQRPKRAGSES